MAILKVIGLMLVSAILAVTFFYLGLHALEKEAKHYDQVRADRCAQMGENIPEGMEKYCEGLGV